MKLSELDPKEYTVLSTPKPSKPLRLSDLDPSEIEVVSEPPEEKGLLTKTLEGLDRYGAAPMRAGYRKMQHSLLNKGIPLDVVGAAKAAYDQFGNEPEKAPTAAQLVEQNPIGRQLNKKGFKDSFAMNPTMVGLRGLMAPVTGWDRSGEIVGEIPRVAAEMLVGAETDPTSYIPGGVISKAVGKPLSAASKGLGNAAGRMAEAATGATRTMAEKFKPGTGKELLERGLVGWFNSPAKVAKKVSSALEESGKNIGKTLKSLDEAGAPPIEKEQLVSQLETRMNELNKKVSTKRVARAMQEMVDDFKSGDIPEKLSLSETEAEKRGLQELANYNSRTVRRAEKEVASIIRESVEGAARNFDPAAGKVFETEKKTFGLLKPVEKATKARAKQLAQSPKLGLLDVATATAGAQAGDDWLERIGGGLAAAIGRRVIGPRINSVLANSLYQASRGAKGLIGASEGARFLPGSVRSVPLDESRKNRNRDNKKN